MKNYADQARVFKAVCDEKRLYIIDLLRQGERCACQLLEDLDISQPSLSYHMKILVESGIVQSRQEGKWTHYSISQAGSLQAVELLSEITNAEDDAEAKCSCQVG
ncbi:MAG: ArsR family transcriptional regulator, arsenate/arsenite/antimonite-responsive transcriptional [Clostridiales bacterium]|jgi:ArsR family transcriptional regulator|nr:metalloregulator ArsR/SmtB family transcription factor [Eubacteriales bacterium]MDN5314783.1 ArsR family transcriptional regulator, arsenate/arsenite/antimonite-responsive transcriptional [Clostridiales bacterium]